MDAVTADDVLAALDPEQRAVAETLHGPVCVLAGAGTGKTRAITHRIAHGVLTGVYTPGQVLAVTFTTRAAAEMRARLRALGAGGVQARTFHSAALRQLQYFWPKVVGGDLPKVIGTKAPLVASAASRCGVRPGQSEVRELAAEIEWAKVIQAVPADYPKVAGVARRDPPAGLDPRAMGELYAAYEQVKRDRDRIDMEDILLLAVGVLTDHAEVAATVRDQYRHLVVDEYQDVNPLQHRLLDLWRGDAEELCVVGDGAQTIYSFAGASADYLLGFPRRHPDAAVIRLVRNYRSSPQVVQVANQLLSAAGGSAAARVTLRAQREPGPAPQVVDYPDEPAEAEGVTAAVRRLLAQGVPAGEIAVLFRVNAQSLAYEQAFDAADIPYLVKGAERFFERPEVRQAIMLLRGAARAAAPERDAAGDGGGLPAEVRAILDARPGSGPGSGSGAEPRGPATETARSRAESTATLVRLAEEVVAADPDADLSRFTAELDARAADAHVPVIDGVTLASLHAAKGLEWDAVFLVGLAEGTVPITYADTEAAVEEERRLLYVGVTRARRYLTLSWSASRTPGGRGGRRASRFLDPVGGAGVRTPSPRTGAGARTRGSRRSTPARCRVCGTALLDAVPRKLGRCQTCPADLDEALYDRLRTWRLECAREQSVPAFCVFTDATLLAIAETRPGAEGELASVPGVGRAKLQRYGPDVLAICAGADPAGQIGE